MTYSIILYYLLGNFMSFAAYKRLQNKYSFHFYVKYMVQYVCLLFRITCLLYLSFIQNSHIPKM